MDEKEFKILNEKCWYLTGFSLDNNGDIPSQLRRIKKLMIDDAKLIYSELSHSLKP